MENMIKYIGKEINFVSKEDLRAAICGEKEKFNDGGKMYDKDQYYKN